MHIDPKKIKLLMARRCMNNKRLAEMAVITQPTISKAISGSNVRTDTVGLIARALGVDPSEIIKEEQ